MPKFTVAHKIAIITSDNRKLTAVELIGKIDFLAGELRGAAKEMMDRTPEEIVESLEKSIKEDPIEEEAPAPAQPPQAELAGEAQA